MVPSFIKMDVNNDPKKTSTIGNVYNIFTKSQNLIVNDFSVTCLTTANESEYNNWY